MLPLTKTVAKEMLPLADKPMIQYAVEEASLRVSRISLLSPAEIKHVWKIILTIFPS
jgi:UTP--glucose-1-phosphate uridylyltransferase